MKKLIYITVISLIVSIAAYAEDPNLEKNPQGAKVGVKGLDGDCDTCTAHMSGTSINTKREYDSLLEGTPGASSNTGGAAGTK